LEQRFNDCKLEKETKNPEEWFTELEHIKVLLKENHTVILSDDKIIQHIVYNLKAKFYETVVFTLKREIEYNHATNPLDLERVKDEIRQVYGQLTKGKTPETALVSGKEKSSRRIVESVEQKVMKQQIDGKMTIIKTKDQHGGKVQRKKAKQQMLLVQAQQLLQQHHPLTVLDQNYIALIA
jgi:hypothetical protein